MNTYYLILANSVISFFYHYYLSYYSFHFCHLVSAFPRPSPRVLPLPPPPATRRTANLRQPLGIGCNGNLFYYIVIIIFICT